MYISEILHMLKKETNYCVITLTKNLGNGQGPCKIVIIYVLPMLKFVCFVVGR